MTLNLTVTPQLHTDFTPRIAVIGVGGGGTNAVNNMISSNLQGVEFIVANTDAQSLISSKAERRIQLGPHITQGLGAGAKPEIGRAAAEEAADEIYRHLEGAHMVFITAGMGGGTGTGAAPVIARMARERGILTVGVVTKPFAFEGNRRAKEAERGIGELVPHVDTLIVIPNQNLFLLANERTGWKEAFKMADHVLYMGVRGVTDLMVVPGMINLDFADIRTVMAEMGKAMMGTGEMEGDNRSLRAAEAAINNPLLENASMAGARGLLINITGGEDMTLFEVNEAMDRIRSEVDDDANIIFGTAIDENLEGKIRVSVVATGIDTPARIASPVLQVVNGGAVGGEGDAVAHAHAHAHTQVQAEAAAHQGPARAGAMQPAMPAAAPARPAMPPPLPLGGARPAARPAEEAASMGAQLRERDQGREYEPISDDQPLPPRRIPEHLQRPVTAAKPGPAYQSPLFHARDGAAAPAAPSSRKSLFSMVTGAIRGSLPQAAHHAPAPQAAHHAVAATAVRTAPSEPGQAELAAEPMTETLRPSGSDEKIEIPTFLRRQTS